MVVHLGIKGTGAVDFECDEDEGKGDDTCPCEGGIILHPYDNSNDEVGEGGGKDEAVEEELLGDISLELCQGDIVGERRLTRQNAPPLSILVTKTYMSKYFFNQLSTRKYRKPTTSISGCSVAKASAIVK